MQNKKVDGDLWDTKKVSLIKCILNIWPVESVMQQITIEDFQENTEVIIDNVNNGEMYIVHNNNKPVLVLLSCEDYEVLTGVSLETGDD